MKREKMEFKNVKSKEGKLNLKRKEKKREKNKLKKMIFQRKKFFAFFID